MVTFMIESHYEQVGQSIKWKHNVIWLFAKFHLLFVVWLYKAKSTWQVASCSTRFCIDIFISHLTEFFLILCLQFWLMFICSMELVPAMDWMDDHQRIWMRRWNCIPLVQSRSSQHIVFSEIRTVYDLPKVFTHHGIFHMHLVVIVLSIFNFSAILYLFISATNFGSSAWGPLRVHHGFAVFLFIR